MKRVLIASVVLTLLFSMTAGAQSVEKTKKLEALPRDLEIELALSALPASLRDNATVYVLNPDKGFEVARNGTNGFNTFVARIGSDAFRGTWVLKEYPADILQPISFDEVGAKTIMPVFFDAAEMEAKGTPPEELKKIIQDRYKKHYYKAPTRPGVSYMEAPILRTYVNPDQVQDLATTNIPHVMHYAPNTSNKEVGAAYPEGEQINHYMMHGRWKETPQPFVIQEGPHGFFIQFLGVTERDAINKEYADMLTQLCKIKDAWCLPQ